MQKDFHYYATYCAAFLAGYSHDESLSIAYADQFTDVCTVTMLDKMKAPLTAATTQLQSELVNQRVDLVGLQEVTRIWASFHFLPHDLYASHPHQIKSRIYLNKYRLICKPNGKLVKRTVELVKGKGLPAIGMAMHILADTWAHAYFAGTPSMVINNAGDPFYEIIGEGENVRKVLIDFNNNPGKHDNLEKSHYVNSVYVTDENSIMNLGHGRAGHLPDYSFVRYEYMPAWGEYHAIFKDNPSEYYHAFCQMVQAMLYLRGQIDEFELDQYAFDIVAPWKDKIHQILTKRQLDACVDWKAFGEALSGCTIPDFDQKKYAEEYGKASKEEKDQTEAGQYILAAMKQKSMVTDAIFESKNLLAGFSIHTMEKRLFGIRTLRKSLSMWRKGDKS